MHAGKSGSGERTRCGRCERLYRLSSYTNLALSGRATFGTEISELGFMTGIDSRWSGSSKQNLIFKTFSTTSTNTVHCPRESNQINAFANALQTVVIRPPTLFFILFYFFDRPPVIYPPTVTLCQGSYTIPDLSRDEK